MTRKPSSKKTRTTKKKTSKRSQTKLPTVGKDVTIPKGQNIIRKDYFEDRYVIFATARGKRPHEFVQSTQETKGSENCPFCPHNQNKILVIEETPGDNNFGWQFRAVKNLYGIVSDAESYKQERYCSPQLYHEQKAYGHAEVVIESPEHEDELDTITTKKVAQLISFLARRTRALYAKKGVRYVSVLKNNGAKAGASIPHSHTQIITTPTVPEGILQLIDAHNKHLARYGTSPYDDILAQEKISPRFICETEQIIAFAPYASEAPMEVWIFPKRRIPSFTLLNKKETKEMAEVLQKLIRQLKTLGDTPYNLLFVNDHDYGELHFHIRLHPRINTPPAGFELLTRFSVPNPVLPEDAAEFYRKGI